MQKRFHIILFAVLCLIAVPSCNGVIPYRNPSLSPQRRADDLLARMTLDEKIGQLVCPLGWPMYEKYSSDSVGISDNYRDFIGKQHGGMLWATFRADPWTKKTLETGLNPYLSAKAYNALQHYAVDSTRLGIPVLLAEEAPHGHMAIGTTVFPTSIGLASTWDTEAVEEVGQTIGRELRAQGSYLGYGPVIDLARELRWSRVEETYGEDVFLTSSMAAAMTRGTGLSTLKHFVAYGIPEGGHNGNASVVGERDLQENFLPPFRAAVDAGAVSVMTSYNTVDGQPSTASRRLLIGALRDEWGFDGFVVSDLESIDGLYGSHHVATDLRNAGEIALEAGVDVDLGAHCFSLLKESVEKGNLSGKALDRAVRRVLVYKFRTGIFDNPYVDEDSAAAQVRTEEASALALKVAQESVTLLENNGILPLKKGVKVAVIGPNADNMYNQLGDYTAPQPQENICTMLEGIKAAAGEGNVTYVKGCFIRDAGYDDVANAANAAASSDVAIVVVGGSSARDFRTKYIDTGAAVADDKSISDMESGEGFDRVSLDLMGRQQQLLEAVRATGTPMVVVYIEGRPLDKLWASREADALLTLWYPGQAGGEALASVLWGEYNPAGRLPVSVPRCTGQLPVYYNKRQPKGHDYVEMTSEALYPFGYGLSYTKFEYSDLVVDITGNTDSPSASVHLKVSNTGGMDGDEVVQVYVRDEVASTVRPARQLRGFRRVHVKAGETVDVEISLDSDAFSLVNAEYKKVIEPGEFTIEAGASSSDIRLTTTITL